MANRGQLDDGIIAVGQWWREGGQDQIDAVILARHGRTTTPVLAGECKWGRQVDGTRIVRALRAKAAGLADPDTLRYAVCAREEVTRLPDEAIAVTAADIFAP